MSKAERKRNHGSRARIPGELFRAVARLYLEQKPDVTREGLARKVTDRLDEQGVEYHVRTVRRQILGVVSSIPPEVEEAAKEIAVAELGLDSEPALLAALEARGHVFSDAERRSPYVPIHRLEPITQLWLYYNRGQSKRTLARHLAKDLRAKGVRLSFDSLQGKLAGKGYLVRRAVLDQMVEYLAPHGISSEDEALSRKHEEREDVDHTIKGRELTDSKQFRKLCRLWQLQHREGSSRRLAQLLRERLSEQGVEMSITHLQRAIGGKTPRIRRDLVVTMAMLLEEALPEGKSLRDTLDSASWNGTRNLDLAWVSCDPIAVMAEEWVRANDDSSMRQLAIKVAGTIRRMGYKSSHNTIQPILGGWKKKTRGYVYRAMLKQFPERANESIPDEHLLGPIPGAEFAEEERRKKAVQKMPSATTFLRNAKKQIEGGSRSPHLARLLALRAETVYGIPAADAQARIEGRRRRNAKPLGGSTRAASGFDGAQPAFAADEPVSSERDEAFGEESAAFTSDEQTRGFGEAPMARFFDSEE